MILLTGAAGFIGSNVLKALNDLGRDDIICADDLTNGAKCRNLAGKKFWRYVDHREVFALDSSLVHEVVHMGANVDTACTDGRKMVQDNYDAAVDIYAHFVANKSGRAFIYASTGGVYGNKPAADGAPFQETPEAESPQSPYAFSKWLLDCYMRIELAAAAATSAGPTITSLRFFNVYGPGEQHKGRMRSAVGNMLNDINENRRPRLFDGSEWFCRDFVWIDDAVNTVLWALDNRPSGIFNVGSGVARSFQDVYAAVVEATGYDGHPEHVNFPNDLPYYQPYTKADLTNLRAAGFADSFTTLENGVKKYAAHSLT